MEWHGDAFSCIHLKNNQIFFPARRKPGAKPRRVAPELNTQVADSPRPKSSGSEDSECKKI